MSEFTLKTGLSRGSRIRGLIARELARGAHGSTLRLVRLKALLLRVEERLAAILAGAHDGRSHMPALARVRRR